MRKPTPSRRQVAALRTVELEQVAAGRSGFLNSDPSDANRIIERHELPGNQGG
jgi:hypothetical protein